MVFGGRFPNRRQRGFITKEQQICVCRSWAAPKWLMRRRLDQAKGTVLFPSSRGKAMEQTVVQHGVYYHQPYCKIAPPAMIARDCL